MSFVPSNVDPLAATILTGFVDGVIRFVSVPSMVLQFVYKPHQKRVTTFAFSKNGDIFATGSEDHTVFVFKIYKEKQSVDGILLPFNRSSVSITPLGFIKLESKVKYISFSESESSAKIHSSDSSEKDMKLYTLYITLDNGNLFTANIHDRKFSTSTTYEIPHSEVDLVRFKFSIPEKVIVTKKVEEVEGSKTNLAQSAELCKSLNSIRKKNGLVITAESPIKFVFGLQDGFFLCIMKNLSDEDEIRICHIRKPAFSQLLAVYQEGVSSLNVDYSRQVILLGFERGTCGTLRFSLDKIGLKERGLPNKHDDYEAYTTRFDKIISEAEAKLKENEQNSADDTTNALISGQQWSDHLHELDSRVYGVTASFDYAYLISCGEDGGIFMRRNYLFEIGDSEVEQGGEEVDQFTHLEDITDPNAYSIEEEKLKLEKDLEIERAEKKKQEIRKNIEDLRRNYAKVLEENDAANPEVRLEKSMLIVDPFLEEDTKREAIQREEILLKELAWNAEKEAIGPKKLKERFLEPIQTERVKIVGINSPVSVSTFRTLKIQKYIAAELEPLLVQMDKDHLNRKSEVSYDAYIGKVAIFRKCSS
jgi:WD40 repeat protein